MSNHTRTLQSEPSASSCSERITLEVGQSAIVTFIVLPEFHSYVPETTDVYEGQYVVEEGALAVFVGGGQPDYYEGGLTGSVTVNSTTTLSQCTNLCTQSPDGGFMYL